MWKSIQPWLEKLRRPVRFSIGVLAVWGATTVILNIAQILAYQDPLASRLTENQFCIVSDFRAESVFAPTSCFVYDHEYQIRPTAAPAEHLFDARADRNTLILVEYDSNLPSVTKGGVGRRDVDERLVGVFFISGPLTGRKGMIERYKLRPIK